MIMTLTSTTLITMTISTTTMKISVRTTTQIYRGDVRHKQRHLPTTTRAGFSAVGGWVEVEAKLHGIFPNVPSEELCGCDSVGVDIQQFPVASSPCLEGHSQAVRMIKRDKRFKPEHAVLSFPLRYKDLRYDLELVIVGFLQAVQLPSLLHLLMVSANEIKLN